MTRDDFKDLIKKNTPIALAEKYIESEAVHMFAQGQDYRDFCVRVGALFPKAECIRVAGSGNWGFSLNPNRSFKPFDETSDVDVVIVSLKLYQETWDLIREFHRKAWYTLSHMQRQALKRNGENIYSGFVSPNWISAPRSHERFEFRRSLNKVSDASTGYRRVNAMYFKNLTEAKDYYVRGFSIARAGVQS